MEGESGRRSVSRAQQRGNGPPSLAHAPGKETCSVIPSVAWKWGLLECVRRTDTTTKRRRTRARKRSWFLADSPVSSRFANAGSVFRLSLPCHRPFWPRGGFPAFRENGFKLKVA